MATPSPAERERAHGALRARAPERR